ncbi:MAG: comL [Gammaproteobacteria bacterium]|jgi:outer membrane protein assembly factor BamD|nr:comL [Gammaproteobacteria bacterium]
MDKELQGMSEQQLFTQGEQAVKDENWNHAIKYFETLQSQYPFGPYVKQSQIELIYAHYKNRDFPETQAAADRYLHLYPTSTNNDYVYYLRGLSYFEQDRNVLQRYLNIDLSERDLDSSEKAYQDFFTLVRTYPRSPYNQDAHQRMIYLRDLLALHELHIAQFYMKRNAYMASINRAGFLVQHYQGSPSVEEGLEILITANRKLGRTEEAAKAYAVLKKNYPDSRFLAQLDKKS